MIRTRSKALTVWAGTFQKALFEDLDQESKKVSSRLHSAVEEFNQALIDYSLSLVQGNMPSGELLKTADLYKLGRDEFDQALFEWLAPSSSEVTGQLTGHLTRYLGGTLAWLNTMKELKEWRAGQGSSRVLWLTGLPGVGKSIIAANILNNLILEVEPVSQVPEMFAPSYSGDGDHEESIYLAFFFCKDEEYKLRHAHDIVRTFAYQLGRQSDIFRRELDKERTIEQLSVAESVGILFLFNRLLERPLSVLANSEAARDVCCIIDGLDEADTTAGDDNYSYMSDITILLERLSGLPGVHVLITSRQTPAMSHIIDVIMPVTKQIISDEGDINLYVGYKVSQSQKLARGFNRLNRDPAAFFREYSPGNFLVTHLKLQSLADVIGDEEFDNSLLEDPIEIPKLYRFVLQRISSSVELRKKIFIKEVIRVLIASPRELEVMELKGLLEEMLNQSYSEFEHFLVSLCGTFVRIVPDAMNGRRKAIQIVHQTFRVYVTSDASLNEEFHVSLPEVHGDLSKILLRYMLSHDFGPQLVSGAFQGRNEDIANKTQQKFPVLKYAVQYWSHHLRNSSFDSVSTIELCKEVGKFLSQGPLLLWIEALSLFNVMPLLSLSQKNIVFWTRNQCSPVLPCDGVDLALLDSFAADLARLCYEHSDVIYQMPNVVYSILFELSPLPSVFYNRYSKGRVSVSGGVSVPLNPAIAGVNNTFLDEYDLSAFSHDSRRLVAFSSTQHIRIMLEGSSTTVDMLRAQQGSWAVLAMAFNNRKVSQKNLFAVVHVSLEGRVISYRPELTVWDLDTKSVVNKAPLNLHEVGSKFCLVDWIGFSEDDKVIYCGVWQYDLRKDKLSAKVTPNMRTAFASADAVTISHDNKWVLTLDVSTRSRALSGSVPEQYIEFNKPPFYSYSDDNPANVPGFRQGPRRSQVARYRWLQFWREVTRAYQFSRDSRWFARFTEDHCVVLHDLHHNGSARLIYRPDESWRGIMVNNILFDDMSERLAWTFNHQRNHIDTTRIQFWNTKTMASIGGFQLDRSGWLERIDFGSDENEMLTYCTSVTMWNISLGLRLDQNDNGSDQSELDNWIVGRYVRSQYSIRLEYSPHGLLFLVFPRVDETQLSPSPSNLLSQAPKKTIVIQVFRRNNDHEREAGKIAFDDPLLWQRFSTEKLPKWGYQTASDGQTLAIGNTLLQISDLKHLAIHENITVFPIQTTVDTAFHINASWMACLQRDACHALLLQLYSFSEKRILSSVTLKDDCADNPQLLSHPFTPALIVFDTAAKPNFLVVLVAQLDEPDSPGPVQVWVLDLPSLRVTKSFRFQNAGWICDTMIQANFAPGVGKVVCSESRKSQRWCRIWLVDLEKGSATWQSIPECRHLGFVPSKEIMISITAEGLVQYKSLISIESENYQKGAGQRSFDGATNAPWVKLGWTILVHLPYSFQPTFESEMAVSEKGEIAYVGNFGKRLVQISFDW